MGITSDRETPHSLALLILHHHPSASFRLDLAQAVITQLSEDMRVLGFPNAAKVLHLASASVADATTVATALDIEIARREATAEQRARTEDVSVAQARAEAPRPEQSDVDRKLDVSRSNLAMLDLEAAAAELDAEGRP